MILNSFIHITETERNITRRVQENCYKKNKVPRCSGGIGITNCTTDTMTRNGTNII
jgi:uridylate kinase